MRRYLLKALMCLAVSLVTPWSLQAGPAVDKIKKRGTLQIGVEPGFLPFEMRTPKDEWVGFDVEMVQAFAKTLGIQPKFISTKWDGIIPGLMAGKYDLIASGMTITPERARMVLFSKPYYDAGLKILIGKKFEGQIKNLADLDNEKYTVLTKLGTTGDIFATKNLKKAKIRRMDSEADAAQSVVLGRGDAFIYDKPFMEIYESGQKGKVILLPDLLSSESFGLAARKSDQDLIDAFNTFLDGWKASGGYDAAFKAMFQDLTWKKQFPNQF
ncbi:MAG TPA: transporter substrate-binding domain-containing protein [Oligoflexus sp.]|uniref:transporter substrate-binding domain-containing protein n=1 Tax=Oligoflexus sp. TaxID=1971216 RepID=UPI002D4FD999|nr:transporter substrate-binding domain-containing protein [Oligoflexus sp.]HYX34009.1 transporter substrate-binding domain-containing protein [Oligoflexus sp.]